MDILKYALLKIDMAFIRKWYNLIKFLIDLNLYLSYII